MFEKGATRTIVESEERTEDRNRAARKRDKRCRSQRQSKGGSFRERKVHQQNRARTYKGEICGSQVKLYQLNLNHVEKL